MAPDHSRSDTVQRSDPVFHANPSNPVSHQDYHGTIFLGSMKRKRPLAELK
jgi:hypothetical protein